MDFAPRILAIVLAGGEGCRLHPLTEHRCKPAVPFGCEHRIVDFVLSNLVNSGVHSICLLVQHRPHLLVAHVEQAWGTQRFRSQRFITIVAPPAGSPGFAGTADAVFQNMRLVERFQPDLVLVLAADQIYRMDARQMVEFHVRGGAAATVATVPVPVDACGRFGIVETDEGGRVVRFSEKPKSTCPMPGSRTHALASMGNYIFNFDVLQELSRTRGADAVDFGNHILPGMLKAYKLLAYDFGTNAVPGEPSIGKCGYWRDVGTVDAYFESHFDTLGSSPRFSLANPHWPIHARPGYGQSAQIDSGTIEQSLIACGSVVAGARLDHAVLGRSVLVERDADLDHCIVMERSRIRRGARVRRVIIDEGNDVPPGERIGFDPGHDSRRFHVTAGGIVVVPAGFFPGLGRCAAGVPGARSPGRQEDLASAW